MVPKSMLTAVGDGLGGITIPNRGAGDSKQRRSISRYLIINLGLSEYSTDENASITLVQRSADLSGRREKRAGRQTTVCPALRSVLPHR